jgi:hypothetical protein
MKLIRTFIAAAAAGGFALAASPALAQSGHFIEQGAGAPECTDIGLQVECTGKVAGLGGTTFEITVTAPGIASVECENPGGNVAPGQDTVIDVAGSSGEIPTPRNGQFVFSGEDAIRTATPEPLPPTPTCPNEQWIPHIVDVSFTVATLTLLEDGVASDTVTVPVS